MEKHGYIKQRYIEPGSLWQNAAELKIEEIKKETLKAMPQTNTPRSLWDFEVENAAQLRSHTTQDNYSMIQGRLPR